MQTLLNYGFEQIEWQIALLSFLLAFLLSSVIANQFMNGHSRDYPTHVAWCKA